MSHTTPEISRGALNCNDRIVIQSDSTQVMHSGKRPPAWFTKVKYDEMYFDTFLESSLTFKKQ